MEDFKSGRQLIDFNDQIKFLHDAVEKGLINDIIAAQYEAVFIDEFQDTDPYQYEIFSRLFSKHSVFYIGDPKQSIYGWRKADIATYKRAKNEVHRIYTMNLNFRSTGELLKHLNHFFAIGNPFDDTEITYEAVSAGNTGLGEMTSREEPVRPLEIYEFSNKTAIQGFTANKIAELLNDETVRINGVKLKPSDIAIIVRKNSEARCLKNALSEANVPAITVDDTKVMDSEEASIIRYLMEAVIQPTRGNINRVILNRCFGHTTLTLQKPDDAFYLEIFRELKQIWLESGIYNMLFRFFDLLQVRSVCLNLGIYGQRVLTNLYHIAEILHNTAQKKNYTPSELLQWSYRSRQQEDDEYEQRIESQNNAVQITTIHKCKGLTYKVVFAPHLDLVVRENDFYEFRENGNYCFTHDPSQEQETLWRTQAEQENRRLLYVALTRAQYKVYVCVNNSPYNNTSSLKPFLVNAPAAQRADNMELAVLNDIDRG
ncbi:MAG: UvrD-helicase domain-containing protein [Bacteroidales bacterium]|nr:UvrD-helicase domain-containing protein [Bacteroidales bacterium]